MPSNILSSDKSRNVKGNIILTKKNNWLRKKETMKNSKERIND